MQEVKEKRRIVRLAGCEVGEIIMKGKRGARTAGKDREFVKYRGCCWGRGVQGLGLTGCQEAKEPLRISTLAMIMQRRRFARELWVQKRGVAKDQQKKRLCHEDTGLWYLLGLEQQGEHSVGVEWRRQYAKYASW